MSMDRSGPFESSGKKNFQNSSGRRKGQGRRVSRRAFPRGGWERGCYDHFKSKTNSFDAGSRLTVTLSSLDMGLLYLTGTRS